MLACVLQQEKKESYPLKICYLTCKIFV